MYLRIHDQLTIEEVEDRFHECFPHLKIAFYSRPHELYEGSDKSDRYAPAMKIGDVRKKHFNQAYEIKSWFTVAKVEQELRDIFGLNAQIFRCDAYGNMIQTTLSDNLTLRQQDQLRPPTTHHSPLTTQHSRLPDDKQPFLQ